MKRSKVILSVLACALMAGCARSSSAEALALRGARIHTAANGVIERGVVVIEDGKIAAVGAEGEVSIPSGAETRDLSSTSPAELRRLQEELATWRAALALPEIDAVLDRAAAPELDPAARERLRQLGYLE